MLEVEGGVDDVGAGFGRAWCCLGGALFVLEIGESDVLLLAVAGSGWRSRQVWQNRRNIVIGYSLCGGLRRGDVCTCGQLVWVVGIVYLR